ncbi:hypothetical protein HWV62_37781, partial [Athelia sp. TMB]
MTAALVCPLGVSGKSGGIVLLIHGTGASGDETWAKGPYNIILPTYGKGYDVCYINLPGRALENAAISAEYVAYNIQQLAKQSATGKVFTIGHSQGGGLDIPWALDFFPSIQALVSGFTALSGDFHGTILANSFFSTSTSSTKAKAIWQQAQNSNFLRAQNTDANRPLVPTTSIFTLTDE